MKINEIFKSIQGEGKYAGTPMLFIRLSGCNRKCKYCDTKYHTEEKQMSVDEVAQIIKNSHINHVCWTGGEPLLQREEIIRVIEKTINQGICYSLETNGDLAQARITAFKIFDYVCISPKNIETASRAYKTIQSCTLEHDYDIKIVTDLQTVGTDILEYATMLMPLTTYNKEKDKRICQEVWNYCVKHNLKYSPRLQVNVWGKKRKI